VLALLLKEKQLFAGENVKSLAGKIKKSRLLNRVKQEVARRKNAKENRRSHRIVYYAHPFLTHDCLLANSDSSLAAGGWSGGRQYVSASVTKNRYGTRMQEYWIFEPDAPKPRSAPLIVFLHGWGMNPLYYGAMADHLVRRGNIVVYPRYQADLLTLPRVFLPNTISAIKDAIARLQTEPGHVRPDLNRFAVVGHSVGGLLAANVAAVAKESGLPQVRAVMSVEPRNNLGADKHPFADLKKFRPNTVARHSRRSGHARR